MPPSHSKLSTRFGAALVLCLATACSTYGPPSLPAGASVADATRALGKPTGEYVLPEGARRVEFARGPMGKHTYMLDFDAQGRLFGWDQVLTEAFFSQVRPGMSQDEVLLLLGRPSEKEGLHFQSLVVWSYRYEAPFCRWFQIGINRAGHVADAAYGTDPQCEAIDRGDRF